MFENRGASWGGAGFGGVPSQGQLAVLKSMRGLGLITTGSAPCTPLLQPAPPFAFFVFISTLPCTTPCNLFFLTRPV